MHIAFEQHQANELIRQQQQGLGKPIISAKMKNHQLIAVGNRVYSSSSWKTFPDFLSYYIKKTIDEDWGNSEIAKPLTERHIILQWYDTYCRLQKKHIGDSGELKSLPMAGVACCYLGLAYNLYLLSHNVELQERFLNRLKDIGNFQGAYYELIIANCLIRAGFELCLEDEADTTSKHCEFSAISKRTGKKYWVEAKMRGVIGLLGRTNKDGTNRPDPTSHLSKHIKNALKKPAKDERLIFVDLNAEPQTDGTEPSWIEKAASRMDMSEKELKGRQCAYIFVTNMPCHRTLDNEITRHTVMPYGLGIPDFNKPGHYRLSETYRRKQKHIDAHHILESFSKYPAIPSTFDGTLPSEAFNDNLQRLVIGETFFFEDIGENGVEGTVTTACVDESKKIIYYAIFTKDGTSQILTRPMSDYELTDYLNHPDTFFGKVQKVGGEIKSPYELFEFFLDSYRETPKERLLELMNNHPDIDALRKMEQSNLSIEYCERLVVSNTNINKLL